MNRRDGSGEVDFNRMNAVGCVSAAELQAALMAVVGKFDGIAVAAMLGGHRLEFA
jgi:hypothetical protein